MYKLTYHPINHLKGYSFTQCFYLGHYGQRVNYKEEIYVRTCLPPSLNNWELPQNVTNFCEKSRPHFIELFRAYVSMYIKIYL